MCLWVVEGGAGPSECGVRPVLAKGGGGPLTLVKVDLVTDVEPELMSRWSLTQAAREQWPVRSQSQLAQSVTQSFGRKTQ